jgi:hypothetical protein
MRKTSTRRLWAGITLVVLTGVAAFFATLSMTGGSTGEPGAPPEDLEKGYEWVEKEESKPGFVGDKLGIFIDGTYQGESVVSIPEGYTTIQDLCPPEAPSTVASWDQAGELKFELDLSSEYQFAPDDPDTGPVACNGIVYVAKRAYNRVPRGHVIIGRSRTNVESGMHWPADRVKIVTIAGRQAVLLEPVFPEWNEFGGTHTEIIFPEPFGKTFVFTADVDLADVMKLAEIVISQTQ